MRPQNTEERLCLGSDDVNNLLFLFFLLLVCVCVHMLHAEASLLFSNLGIIREQSRILLVFDHLS